MPDTIFKTTAAFFAAWTKKLSWFFLISLIVLAGTANITNTFMLKWAFSDGDSSAPKKSLSALENGTAEKPYIYRSTLIKIIGAGVDKIPNETQNLLHQKLTRKGNVREKFFSGVATEAWSTRLSLIYFSAYATIILLTGIYLTSTYATAKRLHQNLAPPGTAPFSPEFVGMVTLTLCSLLTPYIFSRWGHFYDFPDMALTMLSFLAFISKNKFWTITFLTLTCINKDTAFVLPALLLPLSNRFQFPKITLLTCAAAGIAARLYLHDMWATNPGPTFQFNLIGNIQFWLSLRPKFDFAAILAPGIPTPYASNIMVMIPLIFFIIQGIRETPSDFRCFVKISLFVAAISILITGFLDEFRAAIFALPAVICALLSAGVTSRPGCRYQP